MGATPPPYPQYGYVPVSERQPYVQVGSTYVVADRFFPSQIDASFTAHQYLIAAQSGNAVDVPAPPVWGCDAAAGVVVPTLNSDRTQGPGIFPCFDYPTLGDELDAARLSWHYYAPPINGLSIWSAYEAIRHVRYGVDWQQNVLSPETRVLSDVASGDLASVTWVVPDVANSDHAASQSATGPEWVSAIVNAVGKSPFWSSTAIVILWDDWGGWYDHVAPPQLDVHGLGIRTPLLVISPFAKHGYVSHVQYESGSVLHFIETQFGLNALAASDARANDLGDCFDLSAPNRNFQSFAVRHTEQDFLNEHSSMRPPDTD